MKAAAKQTFGRPNRASTKSSGHVIVILLRKLQKLLSEHSLLASSSDGDPSKDRGSRSLAGPFRDLDFVDEHSIRILADP